MAAPTGAVPEVTVALRGVQQVASLEQRRSWGLEHWIDGTFGTFRRRGRTIVLAPNGPRIARLGALSPIGRRQRVGLGRVIDPAVQIRHGGRSVDHASGGPLYDDRRRRRVLVVYHGELHRDGDPTSYYSFLGLAASRDDGASFQDLGPIVSPEIGAEEWLTGGHPSIEVGPGGFVVLDGRFHVYFQDASAPTRINLGVASADVEAVCEAAALGHGVEWVKHRAGDGSAAGPVEELFPLDAAFRSIEWFDVAHHAEAGRVVLVFSSAYRGRWNHFVTVSDDGRRFGPAQQVHATPSQDELLYVTVSSGDPGAQRALRGSEMLVYSVRSPTGGFGRWVDATVECATVSLGFS